MISKQREFLRFMKILSDNECLEHMVLTGSWAEYLYSELDILPEYEANIRTPDVDFLVKNLKKPKQPISIVKLAQEEGMLVETDCVNGITRIFDPNGLEIEFHIAKRGSGIETAMETNLGVTAEALRHLDILSRHTLITTYLGMKIEIPAPEAFAIHKMIINSERKDINEKDRLVINAMFPHLDQTAFEEILNTLSKKDHRRVSDYMENHIIPEQQRKERIEAARANSRH